MLQGLSGLLELSFAMGTGAFVEYLEGDRVRIDYVRAGLIYPLVWDNGEVLDCAFASERVVEKEKQLTLTIHRRDEQGLYLLENHLFGRQGNSLTELDLPGPPVLQHPFGSVPTSRDQTSCHRRFAGAGLFPAPYRIG